MYYVFAFGMLLVFLFTLEPLYLVAAGLFLVAGEISWLTEKLDKILKKAR